MPKNINKKSSFYLKSGNSPLFKMMGSSPAKLEEGEEKVEEVKEVKEVKEVEITPPSSSEMKAYEMPHMLDVSLGETPLSDARKAEIKQFLENQ